MSLVKSLILLVEIADGVSGKSLILLVEIAIGVSGKISDAASRDCYQSIW